MDISLSSSKTEIPLKSKPESKLDLITKKKLILNQNSSFDVKGKTPEELKKMVEKAFKKKFK